MLCAALTTINSSIKSVFFLNKNLCYQLHVGVIKIYDTVASVGVR